MQEKLGRSLLDNVLLCDMQSDTGIVHSSLNGGKLYCDHLLPENILSTEKGLHGGEGVRKDCKNKLD